MAKTNSERQATYRAARHSAGKDGNGERRINHYVSTRAFLALQRLAKHYGITQREMLERLLIREDDLILKEIKLDSPEWDAYFHGGVTA